MDFDKIRSVIERERRACQARLDMTVISSVRADLTERLAAMDEVLAELPPPASPKQPDAR